MENISTGIGEVNTQFGLMDKQLEDTPQAECLSFQKLMDQMFLNQLSMRKINGPFRLSIEDFANDFGFSIIQN